MCPFCGSDIAEYENKAFEEKLINALRHPERETVQRAVYILGKLKSVKSVQPLLKLYKQTFSVFLKMEILKSLYEIGSPEAKKFIMKMTESDVSLIRRIATELETES